MTRYFFLPIADPESGLAPDEVTKLAEAEIAFVVYGRPRAEPIAFTAKVWDASNLVAALNYFNP